ncbi:MAG: Ig-like domain-containing protein [Spirochaetales bacterium]|nr:Ig-like domain-containing protein [Spirochaetales bacterium]
MFFSFTALLPAQTLSVVGGGKYDQIAPNPIPVTTSGASDIGVLLIDLTSTGGASYIGQIDIALNAGDTLGTGHISGVKAYLNTLNKYDPTVPAGTWTPLVTSFSTTASSVTITTSDGAAVVPAGANRALWIAFDYDAGTRTDTPKVVSYYISQILYGAAAGGTGSPFDPAGDPNSTDAINDYYVTVAGTGRVVSDEESQGATDVEVFSLTFGGGADDENVTKKIFSVTLQSLGPRDLDVDTAGVRLHLDQGTVGTYDDLATDPQIAVGTISAGQVTLEPSPVDVNAWFTDTTKNYLVIVNVSATAVIGNSIGFQLADPSDDVVFADAVEDPGTYLSGQYEQAGYITSATTIPTTGDWDFEVIPAPDLATPRVIATTPRNGESNVEPDTVIEIVFSQYMQQVSVENAGNYTVTDLTNGGTMTVTPTYNNLAQTVTLATATLSWEATYSVVLKSSIVDVDGQTLLEEYGEDYEFIFTVRPQYPTVTEPTALNNRIVSGGNSQVVILIPEPPGGASTLMSVQVFTTTGKLVRSFYKDERYSAISASLPILWDGTNGRGQPLGPGMYFIQIRAADYKRVLKVLIVR